MHPALTLPVQNTIQLDEPPGVAALPLIDGYHLLSVLGRGGMGIVYKAVELNKSKRTVALKTILAGAQASPREREQFDREVEAIARLEHPNIVRLYHVGAHNGQPFFTLEFVEHGTLSRKLGGKAQPTRYAATMVKILAEAVEYAHQHRVVHRDLKPGNVLIGDRGVLKISDFGLAKLLDARPGETTSGTPKGTPAYMAPEQTWASKSQDIGPSTDVYALGAILYEIITGSPPFKGDSVRDVLNKVVTQEPVPPRKRNKTVAADLETICLKCLEKNPKLRYGSAQQLADDVGRFLEGEAINARPVGRVGRA
jgi:serine/threonine-protein kinase